MVNTLFKTRANHKGLIHFYLFQKNPDNIRTAEENRGIINKTLGILLYVPKSNEISKHVTTMCADALDSTYTSYTDLEVWSTLSGK